MNSVIHSNEFNKRNFNGLNFKDKRVSDHTLIQTPIAGSSHLEDMCVARDEMARAHI